jgi:hypothetical protein
LTSLQKLGQEVRTNRELRRELYSMALYVAIVLLSALAVVDDDHPPTRGEVLLIEFGTTFGLVLAHGFAAWVSTRIMGMDEDTEHVGPIDLLKVQMVGASAVAALAMLAVIVVPVRLDLVAARFTVAFTIAGIVFLESRAKNSGARAAVYGLLALLAGVVVAAVKTALIH